MTRPGFHLADAHLPEGVVSLVEVPALAISSTDCRDRVGRGMPVWYLVPDGVVQYIEKRGLYREGRRRTRATRTGARAGTGGVRLLARPDRSRTTRVARPRQPDHRPGPPDPRSPGGAPMTASAEARETALLAAQAAADKLATDVSIVDVSDRLAITDAFVLASAPNERQVQAIVDEVEERLRAHGVKPVRREGRRRVALGAAGLRRRGGARPARRGAGLLRPRAAVEGLPHDPLRRPRRPRRRRRGDARRCS